MYALILKQKYTIYSAPYAVSHFVYQQKMKKKK